MSNVGGSSNTTGRSPGPDDALSLAEALGVTIRYAPDDLAPPVDHERLRAFVRRELPESVAAEVSRLTALFRSWHNGWAQALEDEAQQQLG